ncbi:hypothetical protein IEQ34_019052 [Dendrobium chrysotoxum]|uniref:Uncharacterized protein n=1 Tax=Dendrobium chrysotoxum TaxID=161865 RepID=A0AAV7G7L3_DENCH|nr:hypothetical protein IEQ34_019052 [Dendrobium chrysotoxum]
MLVGQQRFIDDNHAMYCGFALASKRLLQTFYFAVEGGISFDCPHALVRFPPAFSVGSSKVMMIAVPAVVKRYSVPLVLFALGLFFQLVVLPSSYPTSHYDVLRVKRLAPVEEIEEAYNKISSKCPSDSSVALNIERCGSPPSFDFAKNCPAPRRWVHNIKVLGHTAPERSDTQHWGTRTYSTG